MNDEDVKLDAEEIESVEDNIETGESEEQEDLEQTEEPQEEETPQEEPTQTTKEEPKEDLSPRQQRRIDQILDRVSNGTRGKDSYKPLDYKSTIDADEDTVKQLSDDREKYAQHQYNEGLEQVKASEWKTNIRISLPLVKDKLDRLDPSDVSTMDREYLLYSGFNKETGRVQNPDIDYADFMEARIEQAERLAKNLNIKSQQNITRQAAQTGLRPTGGTSKSNKISSAEDVASISAADWEKNKVAYLRQMGIK
jgi:hypothetical protein